MLRLANLGSFNGKFGSDPRTTKSFAAEREKGFWSSSDSGAVARGASLLTINFE